MGNSGDDTSGQSKAGAPAATTAPEAGPADGCEKVAPPAAPSFEKLLLKSLRQLDHALGSQESRADNRLVARGLRFLGLLRRQFDAEQFLGVAEKLFPEAPAGGALEDDPAEEPAAEPAAFEFTTTEEVPDEAITSKAAFVRLLKNLAAPIVAEQRKMKAAELKAAEEKAAAAAAAEKAAAEAKAMEVDEAAGGPAVPAATGSAPAPGSAEKPPGGKKTDTKGGSAKGGSAKGGSEVGSAAKGTSDGSSGKQPTKNGRGTAAPSPAEATKGESAAANDAEAEKDAPVDWAQLEKFGCSHDARMFMGTVLLMVCVSRRATRPQSCFPLVDDLARYFCYSFNPKKPRLNGLIAAKAAYYMSRVMENAGHLDALRPLLMRLQRTAVLRKETLLQAVALNQILRDFIAAGSYDAAFKLIRKTPYPESLRSNSQHCRYLYYLARVLSMRMEYNEAFQAVSQGIRKAPSESANYGKGFRLEIYKLSVVLQLLVGEMPPRTIFNQKDIAKDLAAYADIVQAVRSGDLTEFGNTVDTHRRRFAEDRNLMLIERLRHSVLRAGLRKISVSHSRISLVDITKKLGLKSANDTQFIVAKAIADGVIDAVIDEKAQIVVMNTAAVAIDDPKAAYHKRITFCLQMYNDAVAAMQYKSRHSSAKQEELRQLTEEDPLTKHLDLDDMELGDDADLL